MKITMIVASALLLSAGIGAGMSGHGARAAANGKQSDAAYRDGAYQAKIDVSERRKPHLACGRWSSDQDRASFIQGYEQTYRELAEARSPKLGTFTPAELTGFRHGVLDGLRHRKAAQPFQVSKTENYRNADLGYRQAYSNGYQQGYYSQPDAADLNTISQTSQPF
jgi:hypothetical protein